MIDETLDLTGKFLLAMPGMSDPRFDRAVIVICAHDPMGSVGIGIGATVSGISFHGLLEQFEIGAGDAPDAKVHFGGPVESRRGFLLHSRDWSGEDTIDIAGRWALSGTVDLLRAIADGTGPSRWIAALGYAGWGAGQLADELGGPGWFIHDGPDDLIFETPVEQRWDAGYRNAGVDTRLLSIASGTA